MANTKSTAKRILTNKKADLRNKSHKSKLKTEVKKLKTAVEANDENASTLLPKIYKIIDSGITKKIWHKNNAARKKSATSKLVNKK